MGQRIVDKVDEEHKQQRALERVRLTVIERVNYWASQGVITSWLAAQLELNDPKLILEALSAFDAKLALLSALWQEVRDYRPQGRTDRVAQFYNGLKDPMMVDDYRRMFEVLKGQITIELEHERAVAERDAIEGAKQLESIRLARIEGERVERERQAAMAEATMADAQRARELQATLLSQHLRWSSDIERYLSSLSERLQREPPQILMDGSYAPDAQWKVQPLSDGRGLHVTVGPRLGSKGMLLEVEAIEPERLRFPSEVKRVLSVPEERGLPMGRPPVLKLTILDRCPEEVCAFVQSHAGSSYMPLVQELETGRLLYNEGRGIARLFAEYFQGRLVLSARGIVRSLSDDKGVFKVKEVSSKLGLPEPAVIEMARDLEGRNEAISVSQDTEYALIDTNDDENHAEVNSKED